MGGTALGRQRPYGCSPVMNEKPLGIFVAELSMEYKLEVMKCSHSRNYSFDKLISSKRIANKFKFNSTSGTTGFVLS